MKKFFFFSIALVFLLGCAQKPPTGDLACRADSDCAANSPPEGMNCEGKFKCVSRQCVFACTDPCLGKAQPIGGCDLLTSGIEYDTVQDSCRTVPFGACEVFSPFESLADCESTCVKENGEDQNTVKPLEPLGDDFVYVSFGIETEEDMERILEKLGTRGNPNGKHRLAVKTHLNPLGNVFNKNDYPFEVDKAMLQQKLDYLESLGLPITFGIFAGKFFSSKTTDYLEQTPANLMWDEDDEPILLDMVGGTYFSISHTSEGLPENEYLEIYESNLKSIASVVAEWQKENPGKIIAASFAGEVKYPPAKEKIGGETVLRWADYNPFAITAFREYLKQKYENDFETFTGKMGILGNEFDGFDDLDPPRGKNRGNWDTLADPQNPYFLAWNEFRVEEVKNHIKDTVRWGKEAGITEDASTKIYSHQAIWDIESGENYYWRGAPISTLELEGINPVVSIYGEKTANEGFIKQVGEIAKGYPGKWGTLQYNPDGPCDKNGECDVDGYPVEEYYRRLKLLEENGARFIGVQGTDQSEIEGEGLSETKHFLRENFYKAVKMFLEEE